MLILTLKSINTTMNQLAGVTFFLSLTESKKGGRQVGTFGKIGSFAEGTEGGRMGANGFFNREEGWGYFFFWEQVEGRRQNGRQFFF